MCKVNKILSELLSEFERKLNRTLTTKEYNFIKWMTENIIKSKRTEG